MTTTTQRGFDFDLPVPTNYDGLPVLVYAGQVGRVAGSATSAAAAETVKVGPDQRLVLRSLLEYGPLSDETLDRLNHRTKPLRPRRAELVKAGLVVDSGQQVKGESGLYMTLWALTAAGEAVARKQVTG